MLKCIVVKLIPDARKLILNTTHGYGAIQNGGSPPELVMVDATPRGNGAEQRYRRLVDHSPNMTCVHESGRVVYLNPVGLKLMAATSLNQVIGRPITEFVHPDSIPAMMARLAGIREIGDATRPSEAVLLRLDGAKLDVEVVSVLTVWEGKPAYQVTFRDLTSQKAADEIVRFQAALVSHVSDAIISTTFNGIVTSWNPAAEIIYRRPAAHALGSPVGEAVGAHLDPRAVVAQGGVLHTTHHAADGMALAVRIAVAVMDTGFALVCSDHTALRRAERHFQTVASLDDGVIVLGSDGGHVESANPAALRILGINDRDALYDPVRRAATLKLYDHDGSPLDCKEPSACELVRSRTAQTGRTFGIDRPSDGTRGWLSVNCRPLNPDDPDDASVLISFTDITSQHRASQQLAHEANHDTLTGLPNRAHILTRIDQRHRCTHPDDMLAAVLFIDLDGFKAINDSLGHGVGDVVLQTAAQRLQRGLRSHDVVGRFGGDEFVALICGQITRSVLDNVTHRMHTLLAEPIQMANITLTLQASIGIAINDPEVDRDSEQMLRHADMAMYAAKSAGGATTCYFTELS